MALCFSSFSVVHFLLLCFTVLNSARNRYTIAVFVRVMVLGKELFALDGSSSRVRLTRLNVQVMPTQAHGISQDVSVLLEQRLLQEGHEHMQWSATLALGVVSTCLHETDWSRKHNIVQLLLKVRMLVPQSHLLPLSHLFGCIWPFRSQNRAVG